MKLLSRCTRTFLVSLLAVSVFVPIFLLSATLKHHISDASTEFIADLSSIKYRTEALKFNAIKQVEGEGLKEPTQLVYEDHNFDSFGRFSSDENNTVEESRNDGGNTPISKTDRTSQNSGGVGEQIQRQNKPSTSLMKEKINQTTVRHNLKVQLPLKRVTHVKLREMKDQVIKAKAYLNFAQLNSNSHLMKELKLRIKEIEHSMGESSKDSDISRSALKRMKSMETTLSKANRLYGDCSAMGKKLRAMTYNAEEQVRTQKDQETFLVQLASRTTPKGLHCLSMRLTSDYFALKPEEREIISQHEVSDPKFYHFAIFSDNVLACAVVVQSTIKAAKEPGKIIFHIVTDSLNFPAISMWFLLNRPRKVTIQVQSIDSFDWLSSKYNTTLENQKSLDPRYTSSLNHLRFYLPDIFPKLNKILFLDHDVVVQRDLTKLWRVNMKGKVNGAVETCQKDDPSYRKMNMLINFSDPTVSSKFDVKACTWAFGMNVFNLQEWRKRNLTETYHKYLRLGSERPLWKAGTLPLGWITFYNQTLALEQKWHLLGLGHHSGIRQSDIEQAAVIHFDGVRKPWLDIVIEDYKQYWRKHVNYDHPHLRQCNIHQ